MGFLHHRHLYYPSVHPSNEERRRKKPVAQNKEWKMIELVWRVMQEVFKELIYCVEHLTDLAIICFLFYPFQYIFELDSRESKRNMSKLSFSLPVTVRTKWKCTSHKATKYEVKTSSRMHHIKTMCLFNSSSRCLGIIFIIYSVVLLYKDH